MISIQCFRTVGFTPPEYDLPVQRQDVQPVLDKWYNSGHMPELLGVDVGHDLDNFPLPRSIPFPKPQIGKLYWPGFGASRFAFATYLIDHYTLGLLQADLLDDNHVVVHFRDHQNDDGETERKFRMQVVAVRPLVNPDGATAPIAEPTENDAYVMTLVDTRYYWQFAQGVDKSDSWKPVSWTDLFNALVTRLNQTGTYTLADSVSAAYSAPSDRWSKLNMQGKETAYLLDAAAAQVGKRVVVDNLGAIKIQGPTTTAFTDVTTFHTTNLDRFRFGGLIAASDVNTGVPESVTALTGTTPNVVEHQVFLNTLGLTPYGINQGVLGYTVVAWLDAGGAATQWAKDFYDWQIVPLDVTYVGVPESFTWSGYVGHLEIYHDGEELWTRVARPPFNYSPLPAATYATAEQETCPNGCGWLAGLSTKCCLQVTVTDVLGRCACINNTQSIVLNPREVSSDWVSTDKFVICDGTSEVLRFFVNSTGRPELHYGDPGDAFVFDCCGRNTAYFTGGLAKCSGTDACADPAGNIFRLKVEVVQCPGVGSGSGTGSGPVPTPCDAGTGFSPTTQLLVNWADAGTLLSWGTALLTYFPGSDSWIGTGTFHNTGCDPVDVTFEYACHNLCTPEAPCWTWEIRASCSNGGSLNWTAFPLGGPLGGDWNFCNPTACFGGVANIITQ